jgi:hypothetical protein
MSIWIICSRRRDWLPVRRLREQRHQDPREGSRDLGLARAEVQGRTGCDWNVGRLERYGLMIRQNDRNNCGG